MSFLKSVVLWLSLAAVLSTAGTASAQAVAAAPEESKPAAVTVPEGGVPRYVLPETPEQRKARLKTDVDPGPDPDPATVFVREGRRHTIAKFEKEWATYTSRPGWVKPFANIHIPHEIYQENEKYVWVWRPEPATVAASEPGQSLTSNRKYSDKDIEYFRQLRAEFEPLPVPKSSKTVRFEESSNGLPMEGSWRNGADVADMNRDGILDLVLPPQRGAADNPAIYLGARDGSWTRWNIRWPRAINYGTVAAADFDKDGDLDLAFGVHLSGVAVFLHDGKGGFTEVLDPVLQDFPTRRIVTTDVDADGWVDIVAISEGPVGRLEDRGVRHTGTLRTFLNRDKGRRWQLENVAAQSEMVGGDFLTALNFNGDRYPDLLASSVYFNSTHTLFTSSGKGEWDSFGAVGLNIPGRSYYAANAAGKFVRGARTEDALLAYARNWPTNLDRRSVPEPPLSRVTGIDRVTFSEGKGVRVPVVRWEGFLTVRGMDVGDFDRDGNLDILYANDADRTMNLLLGDGKGSFVQAKLEGLPLLPQQTYDLVVTDLNRDGQPDVLVMYEADERTAFAKKNGSVRVYLNRGSVEGN